jgi:hypothetical protein
MPTNFAPWYPLEMSSQPCADISFRRIGSTAIEVTMHFSRVAGGMGQDLRLLFNEALGFRWMEELPYAMAGEALPTLPKCADPQWSSWTAPLLVSDDSRWVTDVAGHPVFASARHFLMISMNEVVEVLAKPSIVATWTIANEV